VSFYKLIQGNCLQVLPTLEESSVDLIITSPPYNVGKKYEVSDEIPWSQWYDLISRFLSDSFRILRDGGVIALNVLKEAKWQLNHKFSYTWNDYTESYPPRNRPKGRLEPVFNRVYSLMENTGFKMRESIIWVKGTQTNDAIMPIAYNYKMGCDSDPFLRGCCEMILLGSKERWFHDGGTGRRGREAQPYEEFTKDVWVINGKTDPEHPAVFPKEIPTRLIKLFIHRVNTQELPSPVVLDPFCGSGTTLEACRDLDINFIGIEINPSFCNLIKKRYFGQQFLTKQADYEFSQF